MPWREGNRTSLFATVWQRFDTSPVSAGHANARAVMVPGIAVGQPIAAWRRCHTPLYQWVMDDRVALKARPAAPIGPLSAGPASVAMVIGTRYASNLASVTVASPTMRDRTVHARQPVPSDGTDSGGCRIYGTMEPAESLRAEWWACALAYWRRAHRVKLSLIWRAFLGR